MLTLEQRTNSAIDRLVHDELLADDTSQVREAVQRILASEFSETWIREPPWHAERRYFWWRKDSEDEKQMVRVDEATDGRIFVSLKGDTWRNVHDVGGEWLPIRYPEELT